MNKGIFYTALSAILYGSIGYFGAWLLVHGLSVGDLLLWRFLGSVLLLVPFVFPAARKIRRENLKALMALFFYGAIFYGFGTAMYFEASKSIGTGLAMVIFFGYPIFVTALSVFLHKMPLSKIMVASLTLIFAGCLLIAFGDAFEIELKGVLLALASGLGYGCYVFWSKGASKEISPLLCTFVVCLGGLSTFLVYTLIDGRALFIPELPSEWLHIVLFSLIGTVLPVLLMLLGLRTLSVSKAAIISVLEPVTTFVIGVWILNEPASMLQVVGACAILAGAIVVQMDESA